jgi:hypothetical protein
MTRPKNASNIKSVTRGGGCWYHDDSGWVLAAIRFVDDQANRAPDVSFRTSLAGRVKR